jgi:ribosomal protein S18 acetylase RimI-like enzyme
MTRPPAIAVEPARTDELAAAFRLAFQHLSAGDRDTRVRTALELIGHHELDPAGVLVVRGDSGLLGSIVSSTVPGASGLVWPPQVGPAADRATVEDALVQAATRWLAAQGAKLMQALLGGRDVALAGPLERNGFTHITRLWYCRHTLELSADLLGIEERLTYVTYGAGDRELFHRTLLRTYEQTLDCPEVNGVRTVEEVIAGHRCQGAHDPERWWLAFNGGQPVGVLLTTAMPEADGWDLSYLGVAREARGQGVGRQLARKALLEACAAEATQLLLSVDARNRPAWDLYRRLGFEAYDHREVYLAIPGPTSSPNFH